MSDGARTPDSTVPETSDASGSRGHGDQAGARPPRPWWVWLTAVAVVAVAVGALLLSEAVTGTQHSDSSTEDFTQGQGSIPAHSEPGSSRRYASDGLHLRISQRNLWAPAGVRTSTPLRGLSVAITVVIVVPALRATVGPACWQDPTHGYGFGVDSSGTAELVEFAGLAHPDITVLARADGRAIPTGQAVDLQIDCRITRASGSGPVDLSGRIDGIRVVSVTSKTPASGFRYAGFSGTTVRAVPAEWRITRFARSPRAA